MKLIIKRSTLFALIIIPAILVIAASGTAYYFYAQYNGLKRITDGNSKTQALKTIGEVGELMSLPQNEQPTVATVSNAESLRSQPFFARSTNGDQVLIYEKAKIAILYNPSQRKIIEVSTIDLSDQNLQTNTEMVLGATSTAQEVTESPKP
jgi:hypothetical protein